VIDNPWNSTRFTPQASGILPHTIIRVEIKMLKKEMANQASLIMEKLKQELDNRHVRGSEFQASEILAEVSFYVSIYFCNYFF